MKSFILTAEDLEAFDICRGQLERFKKYFPEGLLISHAGVDRLLNTFDAEAKDTMLGNVQTANGWHTGFFLYQHLSVISYEELLSSFKVKALSKEHCQLYHSWLRLHKAEIIKKIQEVRSNAEK